MKYFFLSSLFLLLGFLSPDVEAAENKEVILSVTPRQNEYYGPSTVTLKWAGGNNITEDGNSWYVPAASCKAGNGYAGVLPGSGVQTVFVEATTTYTIECFDSNGIFLAAASTTITIVPIVPFPEISFTASKEAVPPGGGSVTVTWSTTNATQCYSTDGDAKGWGGSNGAALPRPTMGTMEFNLSDGIALTLRCQNGTNAHFSTTKTIRIFEEPLKPTLPYAVLAARPNAVPAQGGDIVLEWTAYNIMSDAKTVCRAINWTVEGSAVLPSLEGSSTPLHITEPQTFLLECQNKWGVTRSSARVFVEGKNGPPATVCGNGIKEGAEACDEGNIASGGKNSACPSACSTTCALNMCGNVVPPPNPIPLPPGGGAGGGAAPAPGGAAPAPAPAVDSPSLVPCGRSQDDKATLNLDERKPCTICHVVVGGQRLIQWGMNAMTVIALTVIFAMGVLYIISAGDQGMMQTAKGGIKASLIGFAIMLSAWLIVNIVLTVLVDNAKKPFDGLIKNGAFNFSCDVNSNSRGK